MVKIGVLGLQGAVREHVKSVEASGAEAVVVKRIEQLEEIDGLILPGGESTTMRRLIDKYAFMEPLRTFAKSGKPMFGTCAGMILLAKTLIGYEEAHIGAMDITVERNASDAKRIVLKPRFQLKAWVKTSLVYLWDVFLTAHTYCAEQTHHKSYVFASHTLFSLVPRSPCSLLPSKRANFIRIKPIS